MAQQTELIGADRVRKRLNGYKQRMENPTEFLEQCGKILSKSAAKTFNQQGRPRWFPRKDNLTHPILDKTGRLRDSVELQQDTADSVYRITISENESSLETGTRVFYGFIHQVKGVRRKNGQWWRVRRPFLKIYDEDKEEAREKARRFFFGKQT